MWGEYVSGLPRIGMGLPPVGTGLPRIGKGLIIGNLLDWYLHHLDW